jgi:hypothetical protein
MLVGIMTLSCNKADVDVSPPEIIILETNPEPGSGIICGSFEGDVFVLWDSDTLLFKLKLVDDQELSQLKVDVHNNFDCHGHRSATQDLFFQKIYNLSGSEQYLDIEIPVGGNPTSGVYHLGLLASDKSGNVTDQSLTYSLIIRNSADTINPILTLAEPQGSVLEKNRGTTIVFNGTLSDNNPLKIGGNSAIELLYKNRNSGNYFRAFTLDLADIDSNAHQFSHNWVIPNTLVRGTYDLLLLAYDGVRNESTPINLELRLD